MKNLIIATLLLLALAVSSVAGESKGPDVPAEKDIVAFAASNDQFKTLVAALKAAGLVDTLKGDGPFTVFAPTDKAFAKLPKGTVEALLKPENKDKLANILTYHVVPGKVMAADAGAALAKVDPTSKDAVSKVKAVNGKQLVLAASKGGLTVGGANITKTDIVAKNGVIHVIDSVVLPK